MRDTEWCLTTDKLSQTVQLERIIFTLSFEIGAWKNIMFYSLQLSCNHKEMAYLAMESTWQKSEMRKENEKNLKKVLLSYG